MNLSEEQLSVVEEMAGLFYGPFDISINLGITGNDRENFMAAIELKAMSEPAVLSYLKGRLSTDMLLRKAIRQAAQNGSSPAQQMMLNFFKESQI